MAKWFYGGLQKLQRFTVLRWLAHQLGVDRVVIWLWRKFVEREWKKSKKP